MSSSSSEDLDRTVRHHIYDLTLRRGFPPRIDETADALHRSSQEVRSSFQRLAAGRVLVLQPEGGEILMANPFSAVPTPFVVETGSVSCFANCIWDALGVPAMLHRDARINTACGCCGFAMQLSVRGADLRGDGIVHFAIPAVHWWDDILFT